jgi:uncharacterized surface protein with fasciclin (FAS1) repeats
MRPLLACGVLAATTLTAAADHSRPTRTVAQLAAKDGRFSTLVAALKAANLVDALDGDGPFTVLAPTDEAFKKLPEGTVADLLKPENKDRLAAILKYHVIPGKAGFDLAAARPGQQFRYKTLNGASVSLAADRDGFKVNAARIVVQNVPAANGSVQVIDSVLLPPDHSGGGRPNTIPAVAEQAGQFKTLLAALTAADLADALGGPGPFTVFAPTDEAFKKLGGSVKRLLQPENKGELARVLKYHVVAGKVTAKDAVAAERAETLLGRTVRIRIVDGRLRINDSEVVKTDVPAGNGVIHVIDTVLTPPKGH